MSPNPDMTPEIAEKLVAGALGKEVALDRVDGELEAFFGDDEMLTRASLMNFAVFSESPGALLENHRQIREITRNHACRALLICVAPHVAENRARAWVEALCEMNEAGGKLICSEQVSFLLEGESAVSTSSLVFSHLHSDLPLVVWWKGGLSEHFRERLFSRIDRLVVDSSRWADAACQFHILAEALTAGGSRFDEPDRDQFLFHDLAYTRGHQHRRAIARVFDDPRWLEQLASLSEVEIAYAPPHRSAALYLAAWICTQLKAGLKSRGEGEDFRFEADGREVNLRLAAAESPADHAPPIPLVRIRSEAGEICVEPARDPGFLRVTANLGDAEVFAELFPASDRGDGQLVNEILMRGGRNLLLRKVLPKFREMLG